MGWIQRLVDWYRRNNPPWTDSSCRPSDVGMTDTDFLLAVLERVPDGSLADFNQCEPDGWMDELRAWATPPESRSEFGDYIVNRAFVDRLRQLLADDPASLRHLHHIGIVGPKGERLLDSLDNFDMVHLDPDIKAALERGRSRSK